MKVEIEQKDVLGFIKFLKNVGVEFEVRCAAVGRFYAVPMTILPVRSIGNFGIGVFTMMVTTAQ